MNEINAIVTDGDATKADHLLVKYQGMPTKALWTALTGSNKQVVMAIVRDPRCGLERRMRREEGPLVKGPTRIDGSGSTPVMLAAAARRLDVLAELINAGADVKAVEKRFGYSALHYAVFADHLAAIELLVYHGANIDIVSQTARSESLLQLCIMCLHFEAATLLISLGASVDALDQKGEGALHCAAWVCDRGGESGLLLMTLVLNHGADLSVANWEGYTPLHCAKSKSCTVAIDLLLLEGADATILDKFGRTPLQVPHLDFFK